MDDKSGGPSGELPLQSRWTDLGGPVHYVDYGGPAEGPLLVLVHGLGGSLVSWAALGPLLARTARVLAIDLAGFGGTAARGFSASLPANQDLLHRFLIQVAGRPAVLVGHSMGGTIAASQASQHPETVAGVVLISPVVPWVRDELERRLASATAAVGQAIKPASPSVRRRSAPAEPVTAAAPPMSTAFEARVSARLLGQYFAVARQRGWGRSPSADLITAGRSLTWTLLHRRQFAAMLSGVRAPVLWLHGDKDPVVPVGVARNAAMASPTWSFCIGRDIGHDPHREAPSWTAECITTWLSAGPAAADDHVTRPGDRGEARDG